MKKKIVAILTVVLMLTTILVGCSNSFSKIKIRDDFKQDYDYVVLSNGGNAVQYGNYIYFINGTAGYENEDQKSNVWNKVAKGGLYKAKLIDSNDSNNPSKVKADNGENHIFKTTTNSETGLEFQSTPGYVYTDLVNDDISTENKKKTNIVDVQLIAPKVIGTSGYSKGGIFIYDNYIYYATPNANKDKTGTVQTTKTDFMRTKLDGSKTQLIYTTEGVSNTLPYAFYKQNGSVYLTCAYTNSKQLTTIVSFKMTGDKIGKKVVVTEEATSVYFPSRSTYDSSVEYVVGAEDFIYFTRNIKATDSKSTGNVAELCRPDGSESMVIIMNGSTVTFETVNNGALFYRLTDAAGEITLHFSNLHIDLYKSEDPLKPYSQYYTDYYNRHDNVEGQNKRLHVSESLKSAVNLANYPTTYCYRSDIYSNGGYVLAMSDSKVMLFSNVEEKKTILNEGITLHTVDSNYIYFTLTSGTKLYRTEINVDVADKPEKLEVSHSDIVTSGLNADIVAGYIIYFAFVDEYVTSGGYAYFKDLKVEGASEVLVYQRGTADEKPKEDKK